VVLNYPEDKKEWLTTQNNPEDPRLEPENCLSGESYGWKQKILRLMSIRSGSVWLPGRVVRLKSAYIVEYVNHIEDESGNVTEVHVNYFENSKSGQDVSGIKAKGTLHWVSCAEAVDAEVRLYDRLFSESAPEANGDFMDCLNPRKPGNQDNCKLEPSLAQRPQSGLSINSRAWVTSLVDSKYSEA